MVVSLHNVIFYVYHGVISMYDNFREGDIISYIYILYHINMIF